MYQNHNTYQLRRPYTKQRQFRETGIRTVQVFSYTHVSVSDQRGSLAVKGKREFKGRSLELVKKVNGRAVFTASASFVQTNDGYFPEFSAKFELLLPGLYQTDFFPGGPSFVKVSIAPGCVAQMDWS